jgi:hypothetical protein
VSSQPALQSPPILSYQPNSASNGLSFPANNQLGQSGAAQRLEFAEVDNKNLKAATQNRYAAKPSSGNTNSAAQQSLQLKATPNAAGVSVDGTGTNPNNVANSNAAGAQQVQPLTKAPAPPASMSQSVAPDYGTTPLNSTQSPSQGKVASVEANDHEKIAISEQGKSESAKSGASKPGKASGGEEIAKNSIYESSNSQPDSLGLEASRADLVQKSNNVQKKLQMKNESFDEDIVSRERSNQRSQPAQEGQRAQQGQLARPAFKSESSEQLGQQSQQFNPQQAPLSKPSSGDYTPPQQQIADQRGNHAAPQQQQQQQQQPNFYAFQPQQQQFGIINNQANGRVRAVFILQKKPTQELNSESVEKNLSK